MDLFREGMPGRWLWIALAAWAGLVILSVLARTLHQLVYYGPRAYFRNAFRIDTGTWWLIAALIFLGIGGMMVWFQGL